LKPLFFNGLVIWILANLLLGCLMAPPVTRPSWDFSDVEQCVPNSPKRRAYVSVSSQADTEAADLLRESAELARDPEFELRELAAIYRKRGLDQKTAEQVAAELMANDALGAHARDELSITHMTTARPIQAALTSAATFTIGAILPLLSAWLSPIGTSMIVTVSSASLLFLAMLGAVGAQAGNAPVLRATLRVAFWGAAAMAATAGIGKLVGTAV
jgi:vacuolar iron transporter family protein